MERTGIKLWRQLFHSTRNAWEKKHKTPLVLAVDVEHDDGAEWLWRGLHGHLHVGVNILLLNLLQHTHPLISNTAEPSTNLWVGVLVSFGLQHYSTGTGNKSPKIIDAGYGTGICAFVIDLYAFCKHCCSLFYLVLSRLEHWAKASLRCFAALFLRFLCLPIRYRKKQKTWVRYSFK